MDAIFQDADFPLRAANGFVLKQDGSSVAWCPSSEVAEEIAKRLNLEFEVRQMERGLMADLDRVFAGGGFTSTVPRQESTLTAEKLLANFDEVFPQGVPPGEAAPVPMVPRYDWNPLTGEPLPTQDYHQIIATWPPAVDRDKFWG